MSRILAGRLIAAAAFGILCCNETQGDPPLQARAINSAARTTPLRARASEVEARTAHANEIVGTQLNYAFSLAERGAVFSANARFVECMTSVARVLDAGLETPTHEQALTQGLIALKEADDFAHASPASSHSIDVARVVQGHKTPVLKGADATRISPIEALRQYYAFAQQQLVFAGGSVPAASKALYGMARIEAFRSAQNGLTTTAGSAKAFLFYQTALAVDERNFAAANEVGVLLARYGRLQESKDVLEKSILQHPQPESCQNLSKVYAKLGEVQRAEYLGEAAQELADAPRPQHTDAPFGSLNPPTILWVSATEFAAPGSSSEFTYSPTGRTAGGGTDATSVGAAATAPARREESVLDRASSVILRTFGTKEPAAPHHDTTNRWEAAPARR